MTNTMIEKLVNAGFKRWTNYGKDRLYVDAEKLGLEYNTYNSGHVCGATFNGEEISNGWASEMRHAKTYVDVADGSIHCDIKHSSLIVNAIEQLMA